MAKKIESENYLEYIPVRNPAIGYRVREGNIVTLSVPNTGFFNRLAQRFFTAHKTTRVTLDSVGSFVYLAVDGEKSIETIGRELKKAFGDKAEPLYERLSLFINGMVTKGYITLRKENGETIG